VTVDQYIALGATVATCMLALAAFWTIRMIVRQQRAAYRPELALLRTMIRSTRGSEE